MKNNSSSDVFAAETQTRIALLNLKDEIDAAIATASESDKAKLMQLSQRIADVEKNQTDVRLALLGECISNESSVAEKYYLTVNPEMYDKADAAKTKDEINTSLKELLEARDNYSKAYSEFELAENKKEAQEKINTANQYLEKLNQKMSALENEEK